MWVPHLQHTGFISKQRHWHCLKRYQIWTSLAPFFSDFAAAFGFIITGSYFIFSTVMVLDPASVPSAGSPPIKQYNQWHSTNPSAQALSTATNRIWRWSHSNHPHPRAPFSSRQPSARSTKRSLMRTAISYQPRTLSMLKPALTSNVISAPQSMPFSSSCEYQTHPSTSVHLYSTSGMTCLWATKDSYLTLSSTAISSLWV